MTLGELNALDAAAAERELLRCCGSARWARAVAAARPFASVDALIAAGDRAADALAPADWLEAFAAHPRIGSSGGADRSRDWSAQEQSGVAMATRTVTERLAARNRDYETRFGYIFIVCATGRSAGEMLAMLERRLTNDPASELRVAADEQRKITRLRLAKLLS